MGLFFTIIFLVASIGAEGFKCLQCDEVIQPTFCDTVTQCGHHEKCYMDVFVNAAGAIRYKLGCRDATQCNTHLFGRRDQPQLRKMHTLEETVRVAARSSDSSMLICTECCLGDLCNSVGCGNKAGYPQPSGPVCFTCSQQTEVDDCSTISLCGQDEVCMFHKTRDPVTKADIYETKCENEQKCNKDLSVFKTAVADSLMGKRKKRNSLIINSECLMECCKTPLCNGKCSNTTSSSFPTPTLPSNGLTTQRSVTLFTSSSSTSATAFHGFTLVPKTTAPTTLPTQNCTDGLSECAVASSLVTICSSTDLAKYCQKSCGLCPGSSHWLSWSAWSACTETCGTTGHTIRLRFCSDPSNSGISCGADYEQKVQCNSGPCPVDGHWTTWSIWSRCSVTCGDGTKVRTRSCSNPTPSSGGLLCPNSTFTQDTTTCHKSTCPGFTLAPKTTAPTPLPTQNCTDGLSECAVASSLVTICSSADLAKYCQKSCGLCPGSSHWLTWSAWSACTETCGTTGHTIRLRFCSDPSNSGISCGADYEQKVQCGSGPCPVDGHWTTWSIWSRCSVTCGDGTKVRARSCSNPTPSSGGLLCPNSTFTKDITTCHKSSCPVDGHWTTWSTWSRCSVTCGDGTKVRARSCSNPTPSSGGLLCPNSTFTQETTTCHILTCPVDGQWSTWTHWTTCSVTCGDGTSQRTRSCSTPSSGGMWCSNPNSNKDSKSCSMPPCAGNARDCLDHRRRDGTQPSRSYIIELRSGRHISVLCDMETDNGGWTVFQHRKDSSTDFYQGIHQYAAGFGSKYGNFWQGLDIIHELLQLGPSELYIILKSGTQTFGEKFQHFDVGPAPHYTLLISAGNLDTALSDDMVYSNGAAFSARDWDADTNPYMNIAKQYKGAWWFKDVSIFQLNGEYTAQGMLNYNLPIGYMYESTMMLRRK